MAIHADNDQNNASTSATGGVSRSSSPTPAPQANIMNENQSTPSFLSQLSSIPTVIADRPVAEAVRGFVESAKELAEASKGEYKLDVLTLTQQDVPSLYLSSVLLCVRRATDLNDSVAYHILLLADTNGEPSPLTGNIGGVNVEVQRVYGDALDNDYKQAAFDAVRRAFPQIDANNILYAEGQVVPAGYDFSDKALVRRTLSSATSAATVQLETSRRDFRHMTLQGVQGVNTQARVAFNQPQVSDAVGNPVRSDVSVEFSLVDGSNNAKQYRPGQAPSLNNGEAVRTAAVVRGYIEPIWNPSANYMPNNQFMAPGFATTAGQPQQQPTLYSPNFVITAFETPMAKTLPAQLLALANVAVLSERGLWMGAFQRPHSSAALDPKDIGAIGYEANFGGVSAKVDTRAEAFSAQNLGQLLAATFDPNLVISIDVEECGPTTFQNSIFLAAARGSRQAHDAIYAAANLLTAGALGDEFGPNEQIMINNNNRIHLGYYFQNGEKRDIRDNDLLAMLNIHGDKDLNLVRDFSDTYTRVDQPLEIRLSARRRYLTETIGGEVRITGFAQRVTFNGKFIVALARAIAKCGLSIRAITPYQDVTGMQRAAASFLNGAGIGSQNFGMFNRGGFQAQPGQNFGQQGWGRWGN